MFELLMWMLLQRNGEKTSLKWRDHTHEDISKKKNVQEKGWKDKGKQRNKLDSF